MILKVFGTDNAIHLIENCEDVSVHMGSYSFNPQMPLPIGWGPYTDKDRQPCFPYIYHENLDPSRDQSPKDLLVKVIDYKKGGDWFRVIIDAFAYVCSDDGKTIEKVVASR